MVTTTRSRQDWLKRNFTEESPAFRGHVVFQTLDCEYIDALVGRTMTSS